MDVRIGLDLEGLRELLHAAQPAALLVEPRILRRVIRLDRRLPGLGLSVPHSKTYTIERDRLLAFVDRAELELSRSADLPRTVILLAKPVDDEALDLGPASEALRRYERLLLHANVHLELERRIESEPSPHAWASQRCNRIGDVEFAEIRSVLLKDDLLFPNPSDLETYIEFAAVYLELRHAAEGELPLYFPAIRDWNEIDRIVSRDVDHARLVEQTRLDRRFTERTASSADRLTAGRSIAPSTDSDKPEAEVVHPDISQAADHAKREADREDSSAFRRLQTCAERAAAVGNGIKAAIWQTRAARVAPASLADDIRGAAQKALQEWFVGRLQKVLRLSDDEAVRWCAALAPLLEPAAEGYWSNEARLLYDLQKVCIEHERGVSKLDLIEWIRTLGRRPVRRPLPLLRDVSITRHLRTANRRVTAARMNAEDRERLAALLAVALHRIEHRSRDHIRPLIADVLDQVGLVGQNTPERVAWRKLVEELLDGLVDHGYLSMGDLRDALSKSDLKLPDVAGPMELIRGDRLLRADRKLDGALDGVYRRGAIYLRWPQTLSSLCFGTPVGRFVTRHLALPFGGAYLILEFLRHIVAALSGRGHGTTEAPPDSLAHAPHTLVDAHAEPQGVLIASVFFLGVWLALLINRPAFRAWNIAFLTRCWQFGRKILIELPARVLRSPMVQELLNSQAFAAVQSYLLRPALLTFLSWIPALLVGFPWSRRLAIEVFLVAALFLNSPVGRYATEWTIDVIVRAWHELRMRIFAAIFQWIMDLFHGLLVALERIIYTVDEWLRFRAGDNRLSQSVKLVAGVAWFFVSYVVVFVFTLLVEPQINPIKHFPVVTVSHKVILPSGPLFVNQLEPYIGAARANTLVWATIWLIPGVFGFLVWELKANWRLYAANRSPTLRPVPIGSHGETLVRLLRPGLHSGTLPRAFAALRRAARSAEKTSEWKKVNRKWIAVEHVKEAVGRFVERDLIGLLEEAGILPGVKLSIGEIRTATNRIEVELHHSDHHHAAVWLTWEEMAGGLSAGVSRAGWLDTLPPEHRDMFAIALAGLFHRSGVDDWPDTAVGSSATPVAWDRWVDIWSPELAQPSKARHDTHSLAATPGE